jgi:hypothetical protein
MNAFNELITRWSLIELKDPNRSFSRTNNQEDPIMAKLDRVEVSVESTTTTKHFISKQFGVG